MAQTPGHHRNCGAAYHGGAGYGHSRIIGTVPLHIAALAAEVVNVKLAKLPYSRDKTDLSADEMEAAGAKLVRYKVTALD